MKMRHLFLGLFACAAFSACSNDDLGNDESQKVFEGNEAYMAIRLMDAGSAMTRGKDGGFDYGDTENGENSTDGSHVSTAHFYFYDDNGNYVAQANIWRGGAHVTNPASGGNIEFKGNTVVVLKGLKGQGYPDYMVTVLNKPADFEPGSTLTDMLEKMSVDGKPGIISKTNSDGKNEFVMSTTSYKRGESSEAPYYYVTELEDTDFKLEPIEDDLDDITNPVEVYVERLAAKVTLDVDAELKEAATGGLYLLKATVAGEKNEDIKEEEKTGTGIGATKLYAKINGWYLNGTAKQSYMMKNINTEWTNDDNTTTGLGFNWNDATEPNNNHRSYWGMSFNYDGGTTFTYPENSSEIKDSDALEYYSLESEANNKRGTALGTVAYCPENTNTSAIVTANYPQALTHIVVDATVCGEDGKGLELVRFNGLLYKKNDFLNYILSGVKDKLLYTEEGDKLVAIGIESLELKAEQDGTVTVKLVDSFSAENYKKSDKTQATESDVTDLNTALAGKSEGAIGYNEGRMYYYIPIEHLSTNSITKNETTGAITLIPEAKYGVVRNHYYKVTITGLEKIGKGVYDPENIPIVPDDNEENTYYVAAKINILSWKIVTQDVNL